MLKQQEQQTAETSAPAYQSSFAPQEVPQASQEQAAQAIGTGASPSAETNAAPSFRARFRSSMNRTKSLIVRADGFTLSLFKNNRTARFWTLAALCTLVLCLLQFWRAYHGQGWGVWSWLMQSAKTKTVYDPVKGITLETDYRQPHLITLAQPLLAVGAVVFAWMQFKRNYDQKERDIERQKNEFIKKQEADRRQFEEKAQEDRFKDIQDRFASDDPRTRANAALRLAEMARQHKPNAEDESVCEENYPFFLRAAAPLAIALLIEENPSVQSANKDALADIAKWIKGKQRNDRLLRTLIAKLYSANLTAKSTFIKSFAEYSSDIPAEALNLSIVATFAPFTTNDEATRQTLEYMKTEDDFRSYRRVHRKLHRGIPQDDQHNLLEQMETNARRLIDTRDALALALCALSTPRPIPKPASEAESEQAWRNYSKRFGINLRGAFLAGATLTNAVLIGADFTKAYLRGAKLDYAKLMGATVVTRLYGTLLYKARVVNMDGTNPATMPRVSWENAEFLGASGEDEELRNLLEHLHPNH